MDSYYAWWHIITNRSRQKFLCHYLVFFTLLSTLLESLLLLTFLGFSSVQFSSVAQSCLTLCDPMNRTTPGLLSITISWSSLRLTSIKSVMPSSHLILWRPLLLLPPVPPREGLFEAQNRILKNKKKKEKEKKKTKHSVGKELSIEENNLTTLGPKPTSTT